MRRILIIGIGAVLLVGLVVLLVLIAPRPLNPLVIPLRAALLQRVTSAVSQSLNGSLEIEKVQGSLLSSPVLNGVVLRDADGNIVAQLDELRLAYRLTALLQKRLLVDEISLLRPQVTLTQNADGRLNLSHLTPPSDPDAGPPDTSSSAGLPIDIELGALHIRDGHATLQLPSLPGIRTVDGLQMRLSGHLTPQSAEIHIQELQARTQPAEVNLRTLRGIVQQRDGHIRIGNLQVNTDTTRILLTGTLPSKSQSASLTVNIDPLDITEIGRLLNDETLNGQVHMHLTAEGPPEDLQVASQLRAAGGTLTFSGQFDIASLQPRYQGTLDIAQLDLAAVAQRPALQSDLNLHIDLNGSGVSPDDLQGQVQLEILPSHLGDIVLNPSRIHLDTTSKRFQIKQFNLDTSVAQMTMEGELDLAGNSDLRYDLRAQLTALQPLLGIQALDGVLHLQGMAQGQWPALTTQGTVKANRLRYQTNQLQALTLTYEASQLGGQPQATANAALRHAQLGDFPIEQLDLQASYNGSKRQVDFATQVQQAPTYDGALSGGVNLSDTGQDIRLDTLTIRLHDHTWQAPEPIEMSVHGGKVQVHAFRLAHDDEFVRLSGGLEGTQIQDFRLQAAQIDLDFLRRLLDLPELVSGRANLDALLTGAFADPQVQTELTLHSSPHQSQLFKHLNAKLNYARQHLNSEVRLRQHAEDTVTLSLRLPVDLALTNLTLAQRLQPKDLSIRLGLQQPDLAALQRGLPALPALDGTLQGTINLQGTYAHLALHTELNLQQLGLPGTIEKLNAPLNLTGTLVTADSVPDLAEVLASGNLTAAIRDLTLRCANLTGTLPGQNQPANAIRLSDLLLRADGQWSPKGLHANLYTLQMQAQVLNLPQTQVVLAAHLTPQHVGVSRFHIKMPKSEIQAQGRLTQPDQTLQFKIDIPRLHLDEVARTLPDTLPSEVRGNITIRGSLPEPQVVSRLTYAGARIDTDVSAQLRKSLPHYSAKLNIQNLDVSRFAPDLKGLITTRITLNGKGFAEQGRQATLNVEVNSNAFTLAPSLTAHIRADVQGAAINLQEMQVQSVPVVFNAKGSLSASRTASLNYTLALGDLTPIRDPLGLDIDAKGRLTGEINGPLDALQTHAILNLQAWRYATFQGETLQANLTANGLPATPQAEVKVRLTGVQGPSLPASDLQLDGTYQADQGNFNLTVTEGPFQQTRLAGQALLRDGQQLSLNTLRLQRGDWMWANPEPIEITRTAQGKLDVSQFRLRNNEAEIGMQAHLTPDGQVNGQIRIHQLRLQPNIQAVAPNAAVPDGQLSVNMELGGTLERPEVDGTLQLDALRWQENPLGNIQAKIGLVNNTLQSDLRWLDQQAELLHARGSVGLSAAGALAMHVTASDFDLGRLSSYSEAVLQSAGKLNLDLKLTGTSQQPDVKGKLLVSDGTLQLAATGEAYQDIQTDLRFAGNRLIFEQFQVASRSGNLQLSGWLQTAGSTLDKLDIKMESQDFTAMHTPDIQAVVTTNLAARGSLQELAVDGAVTIPRAQIRVEGLLGGAPAAVSPEQLTVDGVYGPGVESAETSTGKSPKDPKPAPLPFLRANVKVDIPKDVWVRARGTAVELRGKLDVTKKLQQPFILSGDIETVRGFASFFGKKFDLEQGRITFTGTEEINPTLDVIATHNVSSYIVSIHVEGESQQPMLTLSSAPEELEEADIMSLLLFGKTSDRLTSSEESSLSNRAGKAAAGAAAGVAAQVVGEQLGLDTVEVDFGDEPGEARIGAGRYITQDIFLSYERQLGEQSGNTVGVEYSLSRRLRLKGTSSDLGETALDLLWRWDY